MEDRYTELYEKLTRLQWLLQRQHMMNHAAHGPSADTSRGQGRVLAMLKIQPKISTKDLSYLLGIKVASLNELLGKLEKSGYIVRKPSESDGRVMIIHLTDKGRAEQQSGPDYSGIFGCLDETEQEAFAEYLDRVIAALEAQIGIDDDQREQWMQALREQMGDERFGQMMAMRGFGGRGGTERAHRGGFWDHEHAHGFHEHMHERHGRGGANPRERGPRPCPPPPAPKPPQEPDDE